MDQRVAKLVRHYEFVQAERMQGLPFVNDRLRVEAVDFRPFGDDLLGVLVTPWFMNLVLFPGGDEYADRNDGDVLKITIGPEEIDFVLTSIDEAGKTLSAVLFRSVEGFTDQDTARQVAKKIMQLTLDSDPPAVASRKVSRRDLFRAGG